MHLLHQRNPATFVLHQVCGISTGQAPTFEAGRSLADSYDQAGLFLTRQSICVKSVRGRMMRPRKIALIECTNVIAETLRQADTNSPSVAERTPLPHKLPLAFTGMKQVAGEANRPVFPSEATRGKSKQIKPRLLN